MFKGLSIEKMFKNIILGLSVIFMSMGGAGYLAALYIQPQRQANEDFHEGIKPWTAESKARALKSGQKVLIHFTGDACLDCKFQWSLVDKKKLLKAASDYGVNIYEVSLDPGKDNSFGLAELKAYGQGGVPAYVYINSKGEYSVLTDRVWSEDTLIKPFKNL